jgi:hypothetical protein
MPLLATVDGVVVDAVLDLVYETPDGLVLVAYDLDDGRVPGADLLSQALAAVTGRPVVGVGVVAGLAASPPRSDVLANGGTPHRI